jgi:hypothetical protein
LQQVKSFAQMSDNPHLGCSGGFGELESDVFGESQGFIAAAFFLCFSDQAELRRSSSIVIVATDEQLQPKLQRSNSKIDISINFDEIKKKFKQRLKQSKPDAQATRLRAMALSNLETTK